MRKQSKRRIVKQTTPLWEDLPTEILSMIFKRLDHKTLIKTANGVSPLWRTICSQTLFWKEDGTVDLRTLKDICSSSSIERYRPSVGASRKTILRHRRVSGACLPVERRQCLLLMNFLKRIVNELQEKTEYATKIVFPPQLYLSDDHRLFTAQRLPKLEKIFFPYTTHMITGVGFSRALQYWSELKVLSMGPVYFSEYAHVIQELGINCKNLEKVTKTNCNTFTLDEYTSSVIAIHLGQLKTLVLDRCEVYKLGLKNLLTKCRGLEIILSWCKLGSPHGKGIFLGPGFVSFLIKEERASTGNAIIWSISYEDYKLEFDSVVALIDRLWIFLDSDVEIIRGEEDVTSILSPDDEVLEQLQSHETLQQLQPDYYIFL